MGRVQLYELSNLSTSTEEGEEGGRREGRRGRKGGGRRGRKGEEGGREKREEGRRERREEGEKGHINQMREVRQYLQVPAIGHMYTPLSGIT